MSFDPKSKAHKAKLYKTLVAAAELANEQFDQFLQTPFNPPWSLADNYRRNLQRGEYSAIRANVLYDFLLNHHFNIAHLEAPEIFPQTPEMRWREILDERAVRGALRIVPAKRRLGIVQRAELVNAASTALKLGQLFFLEFESKTSGYGIALQGVRNVWHPIPLSQDSSYIAAISRGCNLLPCGRDGQPEPLVENHDLGSHKFALVVGQMPSFPHEIKHIVSQGVHKDFQFHIADACFVE